MALSHLTLCHFPLGSGSFHTGKNNLEFKLPKYGRKPPGTDCGTPVPPYTAHEIPKAHPNLAATPPGHASSPGLSQVSVSTVSSAHLYGHPKGWEAGGAPPYPGGQNAATAPLVYSPPTQPMSAQPQNRPFAPGPRPAHHQFFPRTQMQPARPTIPGNGPSLRAASQSPAPTVYPPNQPIMMTMTMPFPSPQAAQYYIPPYRHGAPYVGPPQQYPVQATGPSTFYPAPSPAEFPAPYPGPPYYASQAVYTPSTPIIVPTPQQPPPAKREKKTIRIRDPNQGGKDVTEEILSGLGGSRNPTPPAGRPSSTPTPPQVRAPMMPFPCLSPPHLPCMFPGYKPKLESAVLKSSSPGLRPTDPPVDRGESSGPVPESSAPERPKRPVASPEQATPVAHFSTPTASKPVPVAAEAPGPATVTEDPRAAPSTTPDLEQSEPDSAPCSLPHSNAASLPSPDLKPMNGLEESYVPPASPTCVSSSLQNMETTPLITSPMQSPSQSSPSTDSSPTTPSAPKTWMKPKEDTAGSQDLPGVIEDSAVASEQRSPSPPPLTAVVEENGEQEAELLRNGGEHTSETEDGDSILALTHKLPLEGEPKRQYNRDFLLGFQFMPACLQKPEGLPPISDVVLDKVNQNKLPLRPVDNRVISRGPDFTPAFADFGRQLPGGRGAPLLNVGLRRPPPRKIITNVSVNDDVQLKKAENAWKPGLKRDNAVDDPEIQRTQDLFRKVRSILNKLTPQMFNQLMKQVTDLTIDTEERLKGVIDLVFEKAIDEPSFSVAYGNMCRCLATLKVPVADKPNSTVNFRKLLLNRCQKEFEKDKLDDDVFEKKQRELEAATSATERDRLQEELEEAKDKARRRSIGNIRFIGELFKLKMLTEAIMHDCVVKLLKNHDEESLECLCRLLTTIGKDLDFEKAKPRMDQYFNQMDKIVKERKTSSRIRFMLQDVIDLRQHNWVSRRADQGPKTIEQIHKEAKIEEQEEQRKVHQQLLTKDNKRRPVVQREETWNTVPVTKNSRTIDPSKIPKISKPPMDDKIQLGPRAQVNWVKGSSGGAGAKAADTDVSRSSSSSLNRYSALQPSVPLGSGSSATPDADSRRSVSSSRSSSGRERNDRLASSAHTRLSAGMKASDESPQEETRLDPADPSKPQGPAPDKAKLERSRSRDSVKLEAPAGLASEKAVLSDEEMERRCRSIIDEFLHINDYKEAMQCVEELSQIAMLHVFVRVGVESTLERSQITRDHMGQLFYQLVQSETLSKAQFFSGFSETLELADDMAIDIPHIWLYLAELVNPMFREGGISMRELFSEFSKPLLPVGRAGILFSEILHLLCKQMQVSYMSKTHTHTHKLEFTVSGCSSPTEATSKTNLPPEELSRQLEKLLLEDMAGDEQIFDWVEATLDECEMSSPPFLRALMTAVCKAAVKWESSSCRVDTATIQGRLPVLLKYLNSDTERQLQALYALQALIVKLDQPPNLLRMFFDCLYDEDVISEDAFYKWEASKDPAEQLGKGVALKSVTAFFTWLREAEEESEDN
uniref:Eukaryotic translation initiation factor 4 gamma 3-like n=1 Tax=Denticeps clupeoides TaxID=299321 RepID=A0AAY4ECQ7_9TELE